MRTCLGIAALVLIAMATQSPAPAMEGMVFQWCVQPPARNTDCHYYTLEQCRTVASAGGGFCYENPAYTVATQGRPEQRRR